MNTIIGPVKGSVRALIALLIAGDVSYLAVAGKFSPEQFMVLAVLVFNFYFLKDALRGGATPAPEPTAAPAVEPVAGEEIVV